MGSKKTVLLVLLPAEEANEEEEEFIVICGDVLVLILWINKIVRRLVGCLDVVKVVVKMF
jgi:hypothetical protein